MSANCSATDGSHVKWLHNEATAQYFRDPLLK